MNLGPQCHSNANPGLGRVTSTILSSLHCHFPWCHLEAPPECVHGGVECALSLCGVTWSKGRSQERAESVRFLLDNCWGTRQEIVQKALKRGFDEIESTSKEQPPTVRPDSRAGVASQKGGRTLRVSNT